jgi:oligopeptide/dipeptide ABC transporter ATP-binding protein
MEVCRFYGMSVPESREKIERLLSDIGLSGDMLNRWPRELSGGQLQRLAIARAIIGEPSLLIADEPLSALDVSVQAQLLNLLDDIRSSQSMAMIFISHDMTVVEYFCDRVAVMYLGKIMELIPASELSNNAMHPYTQSLRASAPRLDVFKDSVKEMETPPISGETPNPQALIKGCPFAPRCPQATLSCTEALQELREVSAGHWVRCHL